MKFSHINTIRWNGFEFKCFEVLGYKDNGKIFVKDYIMVRVFKDGRCINEIFTTHGLADRRLDIYGRKGA